MGNLHQRQKTAGHSQQSINCLIAITFLLRRIQVRQVLTTTTLVLHVHFNVAYVPYLTLTR